MKEGGLGAGTGGMGRLEERQAGCSEEGGGGQERRVPGLEHDNPIIPAHTHL